MNSLTKTISIIVLLAIVSTVGASPILLVNDNDPTNPIFDLPGNEKIEITIKDDGKTEKTDYKIKTTEEAELVLLSQPDEPKKYLLKLPEGNSLAIVDLYSATEHLYQLVVFYIAEQDITTFFGIDKEMLDAMYAELAKREAELLTAEADSVEATATESMQELIMDDSEGGMAMFMEGYDLVFNGVNKYTDPCSYSGLSILVTEDGYVAFNKLTLENCTVDVNGFMELNSDVNLVDSTINVLGNLKAKEGITITETGVSSIIANGDSLNAGEIALDGKLFNRIRVYSDNVATDAEFIIVEEESSHNSTIKYLIFLVVGAMSRYTTND